MERLCCKGWVLRSWFLVLNILKCGGHFSVREINEKCFTIFFTFGLSQGHYTTALKMCFYGKTIRVPINSRPWMVALVYLDSF